MVSSCTGNRMRLLSPLILLPWHEAQKKSWALQAEVRQQNSEPSSKALQQDLLLLAAHRPHRHAATPEAQEEPCAPLGDEPCRQLPLLHTPDLQQISCSVGQTVPCWPQGWCRMLHWKSPSSQAGVRRGRQRWGAITTEQAQEGNKEREIKAVQHLAISK